MDAVKEELTRLATSLTRARDDAERVRQDLGLTHEELCARAKIGRSTYWRFMTNPRKVRLDTLARIAGALGMEMHVTLIDD